MIISIQRGQNCTQVFYKRATLSLTAFWHGSGLFAFSKFNYFYRRKPKSHQFAKALLINCLIKNMQHFRVYCYLSTHFHFSDLWFESRIRWNNYIFLLLTIAFLIRVSSARLLYVWHNDTVQIITESPDPLGPLNITELKQRRFWATDVNWKWTFYIPEQSGFAQNFQLNRLYKSKENKQYKF